VEGLVQVLMAGLSQGSIYALVGLGFSVAFMASRILNLAQGSYAVIGGFIFLTMVGSYRLPMLVAFPITLLISAALGIATERVVNLRAKPWKPVSLDMAVLSTLALLVLFEGAAFLLWGSDPKRGPSIQVGVFRLFGAVVSWQSLWMMLSAAVISIGLHVFLKKTWMGRAMRSCAQNAMMSYLLGINVRRIGAFAFALGAMIGATAGILVSPITWLDYQLGGFFMLNGILAYLIGGEEDVAGPLVGGLLLGLVQNIFLLIPGTTGGLLKQVVPMLILILMLVFRPQGLLAPRRA
jgi:branched-subunit amino acid ABC-type transport system permease component